MRTAYVLNPAAGSRLASHVNRHWETRAILRAPHDSTQDNCGSIPSLAHKKTVLFISRTRRKRCKWDINNGENRRMHLAVKTKLMSESDFSLILELTENLSCSFHLIPSLLVAIHILLASKIIQLKAK